MHELLLVGLRRLACHLVGELLHDLQRVHRGTKKAPTTHPQTDPHTPQPSPSVLSCSSSHRYPTPLRGTRPEWGCWGPGVASGGRVDWRPKSERRGGNQCLPLCHAKFDKNMEMTEYNEEPEHCTSPWVQKYAAAQWLWPHDVSLRTVPIIKLRHVTAKLIRWWLSWTASCPTNVSVDEKGKQWQTAA